MQHDWVTLYQSTGVRLWRAIYVYAGGQRTIADDAVAEAFARGMQVDAEIRRPESWLYRTAFRIAAAELRMQRASEPEALLPSDRAPGEPEMIVLLDALQRLSPRQRAAVYLHYVGDLPVRDVARVMNTTSAAVRVNLHRGRQRLDEILSDEGDDDA